MRSAETRIYSFIKSHGPSRMDGRFFLVSVIVLFAVVAGLVYLYAPTPIPPAKHNLETQTPSTTSVNHKETLAIKEILVEYVHAMLLEQPNNYKNLFTNNFTENNGNILATIPKATSVQISQPKIFITSPNDARVRFTQIIRTSNNSRYSQERLLLKRASTTGWRIDKHASQPIMKSISNINNMSSAHNSFMYIKSEQEKKQDTKKIKELIQFWADAKAEADLEGVVTTYRQDIWEKRGITKEQWLEDFRHPKKVTITNVNVVFPGQDLAEVMLNEQIEHENKRTYLDIHLMLQLSDNDWLISDEDSKIVSEQVKQPMVPPRLKSIIKAEAIAEPTLIRKPETIAVAKSTNKVGIASNTTEQKATPEIPAVTETTALTNLVFKWKEAWSSKDIDAYLGYYSDKFAPKSGMNIEQWRRYRSIRLRKPKTIDIRIRDLQITQQGHTKAAITFTQIYESDLFQDTIRKTLSLVKEHSEWKITREKTEPLKAPAS